LDVASVSHQEAANEQTIYSRSFNIIVCKNTELKNIECSKCLLALNATKERQE